MLPFKDISENNGTYNMDANTDPIIAIRMSTGELMRFDLEAARNYNNASAAGKIIVNYHYAGHNDPIVEAKLFISAVQPFADNDIYCLDAELGQTKEWKQTFCDYVFQETGVRPWDYMNISTTNALGACNDSGLWLAAPSWAFTDTITGLNPGNIYIAQQGPIVNGVDTNMFFGTIDQARAYTYGHAHHSVPAPTPEPIPQPEPIPVVEPATPVVPPEVPTTPAPVPDPTPSVPVQLPETPPVAPSPVVVVATPRLTIFQRILAFIGRLFNKNKKG